METPWSRTEVSPHMLLYGTVSDPCSETVDRILEDCFQLISLFFLTIGRNNEAPAV